MVFPGHDRADVWIALWWCHPRPKRRELLRVPDAGHVHHDDAFWSGSHDDCRHDRRIQGRDRSVPILADERLRRRFRPQHRGSAQLHYRVGDHDGSWIAFGLRAKGPESVTSVQILVWPISFLSNAYVDPSTMPTWLGAIAQWNPLSATTSAIRQLFLNPGWQAGSWSAEHAVLLAIVWPVLLAAIFLPLSVRAYRRLNR